MRTKPYGVQPHNYNPKLTLSQAPYKNVGFIKVDPGARKAKLRAKKALAKARDAFKVVLIGEEKTGKSSLINAWMVRGLLRC